MTAPIHFVGGFLRDNRELFYKGVRAFIVLTMGAWSFVLYNLTRKLLSGVAIYLVRWFVERDVAWGHSVFVGNVVFSLVCGLLTSFFVLLVFLLLFGVVRNFYYIFSGVLFLVLTVFFNSSLFIREIRNNVFDGDVLVLYASPIVSVCVWLICVVVVLWGGKIIKK